MTPFNRIGKVGIAVATLAMFTAVPVATGDETKHPIARPVRPAFAQTTDRIIVQFKADVHPALAPSPLNADRMAMSLTQAAALSVSAGIPLTPVRITLGNLHVLQLDRNRSNDEVAQVVRRLSQDPSVERVEADGRRFAAQTIPFNDPDYASISTSPGSVVGQWYLWGNGVTGGVANYGINAEPAYNANVRGQNVTVAVIDTGLLPHPDIVGQLPAGTSLGNPNCAPNVCAGYDFISANSVAYTGTARNGDATDPGDFIISTDPQFSIQACGGRQDSSWHGTHTAGLIGAAANNGAGIVGVAWGATILPLRVLGKCGGYASDIADAIQWGAGVPITTALPSGLTSPNYTNPHPAQVINLSLAGQGSCTAAEQNAITAALGQGVRAIVVAAGNGFNDNANNYAPANCTGVIAVTATDRNGVLADYASMGSVVTVSAPGGWFPSVNVTNALGANGIWSLWNPGSDGQGGTTAVPFTGTNDAVTDYVWFAGTSEATALVSGVAALVVAASNNTLSAGQVTSILKNTVTPFPDCSCVSNNASSCGTGIVNAGAAVAAANPLNIPPAPTYASCTPTAQLSGTVFNDKNGNGVQDAGEAGIANVSIVWSTSDTTVLGSGQPVTLATATTDANGNYVLTGVRPLSSSIVAFTPTGYTMGTAKIGTLGGTAGSFSVSGTTGAYVSSIPVTASSSGTGYNFPAAVPAAASSSSGSSGGGGGGGCVTAADGNPDLILPLCVLGALLMVGTRRLRPARIRSSVDRERR